MHELGILFGIADTIKEFAKENNIKNIHTLVLEVGAISTVVPEYLEELYPAITESDLLKDCKLRIDIAPAFVKCRECGEVYDVVKEDRICPKCSKTDYDILSGTDFFIKEIIVPDDEYEKHEYDENGNIITGDTETQE